MNTTHTTILLASFLLASCATIPTPTVLPIARILNVAIGTDGTYTNEQIKSLVDRFNGESVGETGILLNAKLYPFDMDEQKKIWPACQKALPCWADYVVLSGIKHDIAIYFKQGCGVFGVVGETDNTKYRYMVLRSADYATFKHEVYHAFHHGHSLTGLMFPVVGVTALSDASLTEIKENKNRVFR